MKRIPSKSKIWLSSRKSASWKQIWADLSKDEASIEIPEWHLEELEKTEKRVKEGKEHFIDWDSAKEAIRNA